MLAYRTIGLDRQNTQKVGLEQTYDTLLKGTTGQRLVRYIAGGVAVPVEDDYEIQPENGKDIVTTIDTRIQEITENALVPGLLVDKLFAFDSPVNSPQSGCHAALPCRTQSSGQSEQASIPATPWTCAPRWTGALQRTSGRPFEVL